MNHIIYIVFLFILWTIFGSFWWVLISREWDKKWIKSIFFGRSKCDKCKKTLSWYELIPILSFVLQKWKCKTCGTKLSNFYRIIEIISGILFVLTYMLFPYESIWGLCAWIAINWWFMLIIIFDIQKYELHTPLWYFVTAISLIYSICFFSVKELLLAWVPLIITFILIYFFGKFYVKLRFKKEWEWFGLGDTFLAITIWFLAPFVFWNNNITIDIINSINFTLIYIVTSCVIWLCYVMVERLISKRKDIKIPFLPSMITAFWVLLFSCNLFINMFR